MAAYKPFGEDVPGPVHHIPILWVHLALTAQPCFSYVSLSPLSPCQGSSFPTLAPHTPLCPGETLGCRALPSPG